MCLSCQQRCCASCRTIACGCACDDPDCWPDAAAVRPESVANDDGAERPERVPVAARGRFQCEAVA